MTLVQREILKRLANSVQHNKISNLEFNASKFLLNICRKLYIIKPPIILRHINTTRSIVDVDGTVLCGTKEWHTMRLKRGKRSRCRWSSTSTLGTSYSRRVLFFPSQRQRGGTSSQNPGNVLILSCSSTFIKSQCFNASVSGALLYNLLRYSILEESAGSCCLQRVIGLISSVGRCF